jgi:hypothetical protein
MLLRLSGTTGALPVIFYLQCMGQYYKAINLDRNIALSPWDFNHSAKLIEHSAFGSTITTAAMHLLAGAWSNNRIVWAGDYADDEACYRNLNIDSGDNLYSRTTRHLKRIKRSQNVPRYLINHDRCECIDLFAIVHHPERLTLHPLPLLTADGNGRGGGDYRGNDHRIGLWARDRLAASNRRPDKYAVVDGTFIE